MPIHFAELERSLEAGFARSEQMHLGHQTPPASSVLQAACDAVFSSKTQAYREVLLGCLVVRLSDRGADIRLPYVDLGPRAFSGRTLDEQLVNPFLHAKSVPCSRGPYLSVFRRQVRFDASTRPGLKDKVGYDAFLDLVGMIEKEREESALLSFLDYVLFRFVLLREQAGIDLLRLERISLSQYRQLVAGLLARPSGGVLPSFLVLAMTQAIVSRFSLPWKVESQGINVADRASGTGGDITIREGNNILLTVEVTERPIDATRVQATFKHKIATAGLSDYVFLVHLNSIEESARQQAQKYFTQGYDVSLADIEQWLVNTLVTVGAKGRKLFQDRMIELLSGSETSTVLRVAWNEEIEKLTA